MVNILLCEVSTSFQRFGTIIKHDPTYMSLTDSILTSPAVMFHCRKSANNSCGYTLTTGCRCIYQHCNTADSSRSADAFLSRGKTNAMDICVSQWPVREDPDSQSLIREEDRLPLI